MAIVETVASATGREPTDLPPLHRTVDPDVLDALLTGGSGRDRDVRVSFEYDGVAVTAGSDGDLAIRATDGGAGTDSDPPDPRADLEAKLQDLLREAARSGASVAGGYEVRNGPGGPDWDVHITRVEKRDGEDA